MTRAEINAADSTGQSETDEQRERLAALILTLPARPSMPCARNYTTARDDAEWLIREADKVGWSLTIKEA